MRILSAISGIVLLILGGAGVFLSIRASRAHQLDWHARIRGGATNAVEALEYCAKAHQCYPHNHRMCEWAAISAYDASSTAEKHLRPWFLEQSEQWCDVALELNPYSGSLRRLKARFLENEDPMKAALFWRDYLDWVYWNEANHYVMVELYAAAGELDLAEEALQVIEGRRYHKEAEQLLFDAWQRLED